MHLRHLAAALALALLSAVAPACGDDNDPSDPTGFGGGEPTAPAPADPTGDDPNACVLDLECGSTWGAICIYPNGCDSPGRCTIGDQPLGECPQNPAPLLDKPDGFDCEDDAYCDKFKGLGDVRCVYWDGQCGAGFAGVCLTFEETEELIQPLPGTSVSWCDGSPRY